MTTRFHGLTSVVLSMLSAALVSACLSVEERGQINQYLLCDDCIDGEREAVVAIGFEATARLGGALYGPPPHRDSIMRFKFRELHGVLESPGMTLDAFVDFHADNYVAQYQRNSAIALGAIGRSGGLVCSVFACGGKARSELRRALVRDSLSRARGAGGFYRLDVLTVIQQELASLGDAPPLPIGGLNLIGFAGPLPVGQSGLLQAQYIDTAGRVIAGGIPGVSLTWESGTEGAATVNNLGLVTAVDDGQTLITVQASVGPLTFSDTTTVVVGPL